MPRWHRTLQTRNMSVSGIRLMVIIHFPDRYVKSDRAVLLINLCVALILAYVIFLAGVDRTENEVRYNAHRRA